MPFMTAMVMNKISLLQYLTQQYDRQNFNLILTAIQNVINRGADSFLFSVTSVSANYTINANDSIVLVDATGGAITITLPIALESEQKRLTVKKIDASANSVTVASQGASLIDGAATKALAAQYVSFDFTAFNGNWYIV